VRGTERLDTEFLIVGSGPGGATLAREFSRAGRRVMLLERGRDWRSHPLYGTYPGALLYADRHALLFTREGLNIIRPLMLGGATSMYCGCSSPPPAWWHDRYGIDLDEDARSAAAELGIAPLPPGLRGEASTRIAAAGIDLGMPWVPQEKFMFPSRATMDCGARCMLGCRCGAKWNAAEYVDDAVRSGCVVLTGTRAVRVNIEGGQACGVAARRGRHAIEIRAERVILAAGGIGSAELLRASGFERAGQGIGMDTTAMVYGRAPFSGIGDDPPMTWSCADDELRVLYSTLIDPWLMYPIILGTQSPLRALTWNRWGRTLGVMIKLKDEISGGIDARGRISKGLTRDDAERMKRAEVVAAGVLRKAGCDPDTIFTTPLRGTHPCATVRIGDMLSTDLETETRNLFVCDASVFPEALARPTVLTIIALARRLARHFASMDRLATPAPRSASHT
jgi:choline dehydrogenase-like flavoprotein